MLAGEEAALYDKKTSSGLDVSDFALEDAWSRVQSSGDAMHGEHAEVVDWLLATYDPASTVGRPCLRYGKSRKSHRKEEQMSASRTSLCWGGEAARKRNGLGER